MVTAQNLDVYSSVLSAGYHQIDNAEVRVYCGQCGTQNNEEAGHCETCGAPLLITAGARTCATCGSSLGDNDRFCPGCGSSTEDALVAASYDANDDFGDLNIDDIEITDLPDWLQDMAPQPGDPAGFAGTEDTRPSDLPDWLREATPGAETETGTAPPQAATGTSGVDHQPADQFSLVSDEDLPEWLRALGEEEPDMPEPEQPASRQESQPASAVATLFDIPPVTRAWLAQGRRVDPSQVSAAQQEFSPLEPFSAPRESEAPARGIWDDGPVSPETEDHDIAVDVDAGEESGSWLASRMFRVVTLAVLIVVVLILVIVLIQGM